MKHKLAVIESSYGCQFATENYESEDYVRISEIIEVEFPPLPKQDVLLRQIALLDEKIRNEERSMIETINALKNRKQELLSLEVLP